MRVVSFYHFAGNSAQRFSYDRGRSMINIEVQLCGLVMMSVLCYFSFKNQSVVLKSARIYRELLVATMCCVAFDAMSVVGIYAAVYTDWFPQWAAVTLCKTYLFTLIWTCCFSFYYVCYDVKRIRNHRKLKWVFAGIALISSLVMTVLPLSYYADGRVVYSYGPAVDLTFIVGPVYIIGTFAVTVMFSKNMNPHRRNAVRVCMILDAVSAMIQLQNRQLLLVGYAMSVGMVILFSKMENPEVGIDRISGVFSFQVFMDYMRQLFEENKACACVIIAENERLDKSDASEEDVILEMTGYLSGISGGKVFRGIGNDFIVTFFSRDMARLEIMEIQKRFRETWVGNVRLQPNLLLIPDTEIAEDAEEIVSVYQYYATNRNNQNGETFVLDQEAFANLRFYKKMQQEVQEALRDDRIEVFLQPIYSVKQQNFPSAEALVRLREKDGGIMMPGSFVPAAEQSGLIEQLGERVFEKVCAMIKGYEMEKLGIRYIEVNLSVKQCENRNLASKYAKVIQDAGIRPDNINLEITESGFVTRREILLENMDALKNFGCTFSLDDFGTGESNLEYIVRMPVDIVKFDRMMLLEYFKNTKAKIMMEHVIEMVKQMGMKIVVEGVEDHSQLEAMETLGADYIQGYYFSRPVPVDEFVEFIKFGNKIQS